MKKEYRVYAGNLFRLREQLAKLNKRATKLGCAPITLTDTGRFEDVTIKNEITGMVQGVQRYHFMEVSGEQPKFNGWSLAACVEHTEEGNMLRKSPSCTIELTQFRDGAQRCDHCKTIRNRRETYIVIHEDGSLKMVGSDCIKDFLGHQDPHALANMAECFFSLGELMDGCEDPEFFGMGGGINLIHVEGFLAFAACVIRHRGFVSAKRAKEAFARGENLDSTASTVHAWIRPFRGAKLGQDYFLPEDQDHEAGQKAQQYVLDTLGARPAEQLNDFEHNLLVVCRCEAVDTKNGGLLAFVPEYYARCLEKAREQAQRGPETYFGEPKKRCRDVRLVYLKSTGWDSEYGWTYVHSFGGPDNSRIVWKTGTNVECQPGQALNATFTVKAHEDWKGHKQTKVSRLVWDVIPAPEAVAGLTPPAETSVAAPAQMVG